MTPLAADSPGAACRRALDAALASPGPLDPALRATLAAAGEPVLDGVLRGFADAHGAAAPPALTGLAAAPAGRDVRRAAKRPPRAVERELTPEARARWARRLGETAFILRQTARPEVAAVAEAAAGEVAPGRIGAVAASRKPSRSEPDPRPPRRP